MLSTSRPTFALVLLELRDCGAGAGCGLRDGGAADSVTVTTKATPIAARRENTHEDLQDEVNCRLFP